ncbi:MAG: nuclear transport factor 2 family protein, partial [Alphaproteobacteria bacterium]
HYNIDVNANQGTGEIYVLAFWGSEGFNYTCSGRYLDKYECRDGDWRISFRQYIYDWSRTTKYRGDDPNQIFSGLKYKGTQNKDDISYKILGKS